MSKRTKELAYVTGIFIVYVGAQVPAAVWPGTVLSALGLVSGVGVSLWMLVRLIRLQNAKEETGR